jgi:methylated-DNA-protein-cysteine methyltransferase-like protein
VPSDEALQRIHATIDSIPKGAVATYGQVAEEAGLPRRARLVGHALRVLAPGSDLAWHRVVNAAGRLSTEGRSQAEQRRRLRREGIEFDTRGRIDLKRFRWSGD